MLRAPLLLLVLACLGIAGLAASADEPMMKAVQCTAFGGPEVLKYTDVRKPVPNEREVLIRVEAAGVNPVDWKIRKGMIKSFAPEPPFVLGYDAAGTIESVGAAVTGFAKGDPVFVFLPIKSPGAYAEYLVAAADIVARRPASIDAISAAGVPLAALTARQAMFETAGLKAGQTILIHGAAGGVGHFAVQLAKAKGATVIATASKENAEWVKSLGADTVIDYKAQRFEDVAKDVDVVFDSIGGETLERSIGVLKKGGFVVSIVERPDPAKLTARGVRGAVILVQADGKQLAEIASQIDAGALKPHVGATFALEDAAKAHEASEQWHGRGKIVLRVQ